MDAPAPDLSGLAPDAIEALLDLHRSERLTNEGVVDAAADESSPLHRYFDWDDGVAAAKWRLEQAAGLIRKVKVTITLSPTEEIRCRAFHVPVPKAGYVHLDEVASSKGAQDALVAQMWRDWQVFQRRYSQLEAFVEHFGHVAVEAPRRAKRAS